MVERCPLIPRLRPKRRPLSFFQRELGLGGWRTIRKQGKMMAKLMSKSQLVEKIAEQHPNNMTRKDVKGVIELLGRDWLQRTQEDGRILCAGVRQIRCYQEACHKGAKGYQPVYKGTDHLQGETGSEDHQGSAGKGRQRRGCVAPALITVSSPKLRKLSADSAAMAGCAHLKMLTSDRPTKYCLVQ